LTEFAALLPCRGRLSLVQKNIPTKPQSFWELNEDDETIKDIKTHYDYLMNHEDILEKLKRIEKASDRDQVIPSKNGEEL